MIKKRNLDPALRSLVMGMILGDVFHVNGYAGDDNATGDDFDHAMKTLANAAKRLVTKHDDYIVCFGEETGTVSIAADAAHGHIIGVGNGGFGNERGRGYQYTCPATVDTIITAAAAHYFEIAGIQFVCNATDHILIDNDAATDGFFHHNTVYGSTTASAAIRLDLEGANWTIADSLFWLCKLPIDIAGAECVIKRCALQDVHIAAKGVVVGANAHRFIIDSCEFNFSGGTGDIGITVTSSADNGIIKYCLFDDGISDAINDSGTNTMIVECYKVGITGTSAASLSLAIND